MFLEFSIYVTVVLLRRKIELLLSSSKHKHVLRYLQREKDWFSLGVHASSLTWFHFLFHFGGFPFCAVASCSLTVLSIGKVVSSEAAFLLGCSHSGPLRCFGVLAAATELTSDPAWPCQGLQANPAFQLPLSTKTFSHMNPCQGTKQKPCLGQQTLNRSGGKKRKTHEDQFSQEGVLLTPGLS